MITLKHEGYDKVLNVPDSLNESLSVLWKSTFNWIYFPLSPLTFACLLSSAICKASSDNSFSFLHFFFFEMVLVTASCTMLQTFVHSSLGTLSITSNPLNLLTSYFCIPIPYNEKDVFFGVSSRRSYMSS